MSIRESGFGGQKEPRKNPLKNHPEGQYIFDIAVEEKIAYLASSRTGDRLEQRDHRIRAKAAEAILHEYFPVANDGELAGRYDEASFETWAFWNRRVNEAVYKREQERLKAEVAKEVPPLKRALLALGLPTSELKERKAQYQEKEAESLDRRTEDVLPEYEARIAGVPEESELLVELEKRDIYVEKTRILTEVFVRKKRKKE